jgi:UDP-glucose 4-epimerase
MTVLITGGAGYIESLAVLAFREAGYEVVVVDNLSTGQREALPADVPFVQGDAGEPETIQEIIRAHGVTGVIHFAGSLSVPESVENSLTYYRNNTAASRNPVQACVESSTRISSIPRPVV